MTIKFEKIAPGMTLYDVHSYKMGNTTMSTLGTWPVKVVSVDPEKRTAVVHWNGNKAETWREYQLRRLHATHPVLVSSSMGYYRRPTKDEKKAIKASGDTRTHWRLDALRALMAKESA